MKRFLFLELTSPPPFYLPWLSSNQRQQYDLAFISDRSADHYLAVFDRFDRQQRMGVSWHWAAFVMTLPWLLYRRRYLDALVYTMVGWSFFQLVLSLGWVLIDFVIPADLTLTLQLGYSVLWLIGFSSIAGLYADAYVYRVTRREVADVAVEALDPEQAKAQLRRLGSTSWLGLAAGLLFYIAALVGFRDQVWPLIVQPWQSELLLQVSEQASDLLAKEQGCTDQVTRQRLLGTQVVFTRQLGSGCAVSAELQRVPFYFNQAIEGSTITLQTQHRRIGGVDYELVDCRSRLRHKPAQTGCLFD